MARVKDLWIEAQTKRFDELVESGMDEETAADIASGEAEGRVTDYLADQADAMKDRLKELGQWPPK